MNERQLLNWTAEHILGYERKTCQGSIGWGNAGYDDEGNLIYDTGFYCDWCGKRRPTTEPIPPCPAYPFPPFTLTDLLRALTTRGHHILIRTDPERDSRVFTILVPKRKQLTPSLTLGGAPLAQSPAPTHTELTRLTDTDNPLLALCKWVHDLEANNAS